MGLVCFQTDSSYEPCRALEQNSILHSHAQGQRSHTQNTVGCVQAGVIGTATWASQNGEALFPFDADAGNLGRTPGQPIPAPARGPNTG